MPAIEGGDNTFVQVNIQTLEKALSPTPDNTNTIKEKTNLTDNQE